MQLLIPQPVWSVHVNGAFVKTQLIKSGLLGGPKPPLTMKSGWGEIDDEMVDTGLSGDWSKASSTLKQGGSIGLLQNQMADFGLPLPLGDDDGDKDSDKEVNEDKQQLDTLAHLHGWTTGGWRVVEDEHQAWLGAGQQDNAPAGVGHRRHGGLHTQDQEESAFDNKYSEQKNWFSKGQILLVSRIMAQKTKVSPWEFVVTKVDVWSFIVPRLRTSMPVSHLI